MGILSSSVSITRYLVEGVLKGAVMDSVLDGLKKNTISEIDQESVELTAGWTSTNKPFIPDFEGSSFVVGPYFIFSLRIDCKRVPSKVIHKYTDMEIAKKLRESGREYLSREEKKMIRDNVTNVLYKRVPAAPDVYDIIWDYEKRQLLFFSNLKKANEIFETLFMKSFSLTPLRMFPYTNAIFDSGLSNSQKDAVTGLSKTDFVE